MTQRVFVDANVLFSKTQMDWLFFLKTENDSMFQLHATEDVFAEVASNMRKRNPRLAGHAVRNRVETMRLVVDEVVETFPADLPFTGRDEHDYHVHAAATYSQADLLLTCNDPSDISTTHDHHYEIIHPDEFFVLVAESAPANMLHPIVQAQIAYWHNKPEFQQLDEALRRASCPKFADIIRRTLQEMARLGKFS